MFHAQRLGALLNLVPVQVVSAVGYAHNQHICHRDLKLENILLGSEGRVGGTRARREGIQRI